MLFNSIDFVIFFPLVVLLYFLTPFKFRWILLLAASYYFYMSWKLEYLILIIISTLIGFGSGILMSKISDKNWRLIILLASLGANLSILFYFKYFNFVAENVNLLFQKLAIHKQFWPIEYLLPVGISFYTFQTLSYSLDVYWKKQEPEKHLGYFALYVSFFPQLVAGPIERYSHLTPQLKEKHSFTYFNLANGLRLILYGLFIKMVIADNLAVFVDKLYAAPENYSSGSILSGIFLYSFQIYCDFYGYSVVAIGTALILGVKLMDNFKTPYLAKNIDEFWQRWHISLSTWFRDYIYFPLGGNRVSKFRWVLNILIIFIVSGIWHGANWTFIVWGALYGCLYLIENTINKMVGIKKEARSFSVKHILLALKTFVLVSFIWVFFRSQSIGEAITIFQLVFHPVQNASAALQVPIFVWIWLGVFIVSDIILYNKRFDSWVEKLPIWGRWTIYGLLIFSIVVYAGLESFPFIYFQF